MNRSAGYTLIEVLIMLAITAILAATVLETVRASTANGIRIEQAARIATQDYITVASVRRAIEASRADYVGEPNTFRGDENGFRSLTSRPIISTAASVEPYSLMLLDTADGVSLVYRQSGRDFQVAQWAGGRGRMSYLVEAESAAGFQTRPGTPPERRWMPEWPTTSLNASTAARTYYQPLPLAIRITISLPDGQEYTIVFRRIISARPTPRIEDLIGSMQ